jgi:hypothetical protein
MTNDPTTILKMTLLRMTIRITLKWVTLLIMTILITLNTADITYNDNPNNT